MVKKRGFDNVYERQSNKSSCQSLSDLLAKLKGGEMVPLKSPLNDDLLNLYKKEPSSTMNTHKADDEVEILESINSTINKAQIKLAIKSSKVKKRKQDDISYDTPVNEQRAENKDNKNESRVEFDRLETPSKSAKKVKRTLNNDISHDTPMNDQSSENKDNKNESRVEFNRLETSSKSSKKVKRTLNNAVTIKEPSITFEDCGGIDNLLEELFMMFMHLEFPELNQDEDNTGERGLLLHGPTGCGKTYLARAIAGQFKVPLIEVLASDLVSGISGESENQIRETFDLAVNTGRCILFIDNIDSITPKREATDSGMEKRIVTQLLRSMDYLDEKDPSLNVMVIGATTSPDSIDPALRGGSRFCNELAIGIPSEESKIEMLKVLCKRIKLAHDFDFAWVAHHTAGYVAADLKNLVAKAKKVTKKRYLASEISASATSSCDSKLKKMLALVNALRSSEEKCSDRIVEISDFEEALKRYIPNFKREGFPSVPSVTWEDVGALEHVKEELQTSIMWPVQFKKFYEEKNITTNEGILLYGPKGCGKTLLAKALANECNINFLSVKGPELLDKYLGESERSVRRCFEKARNSAPCVIFFDEFDALCPSRSVSSSNSAAERVVNQLLTEMDGMQERKQVFVIAATNRKEIIDTAMLRPGRLGKQIYVGLPSPKGRIDILKSITKNKCLAEDLSLEKIALDPRCEGFSGADLSYLVREAVKLASAKVIRDFKSNKVSDLSFNNFNVDWCHFNEVLEKKKVKPSIERNKKTSSNVDEDLEKISSDQRCEDFRSWWRICQNSS